MYIDPTIPSTAARSPRQRELRRGIALPAALLCAALCVCLPARAADSNSAPRLFDDPVVATGKGFEIRRSQVDDAFINYSANLALNGHTVADDDRPMIRSNLLQHIIINKILLQLARDDDKSAARQFVDSRLDRMRSNAPNPEAFEQQIKATGMTQTQMRDRMVDDAVCQRVLTREATNGVVIQPSEIKQYYDDNPAKFDLPEQVHITQILVSTLDPVTKEPLSSAKKKEKYKWASDLKVRADHGEDFGMLVRKYSDDPSARENGAELTFARGQIDSMPEFEAAAFTLKVGQVSDVVETQFRQIGYHIIKLLDKIPASREDFEKATPAIRDYLTERAAEKVLPSCLAKLKTDWNVKLLDGTATNPAKSP